MDEDILYGFYESVPVTGLLTEKELIKELNSEGLSSRFREDLLHRLWTLRVNHFDMA